MIRSAVGAGDSAMARDGRPTSRRRLQPGTRSRRYSKLRSSNPEIVRAGSRPLLPARRLVGHGTLFMLKVKGDSMTEAAIADGDLVVSRRLLVAENGEVVAATLSGIATSEATVKMPQRIGGRMADAPQPCLPADTRGQRHHHWRGGCCSPTSDRKRSRSDYAASPADSGTPNRGLIICGSR